MKNEDELVIHIIHGYDTVVTPEGQSCYGCYLNGEYEAYIPDDMPSDQFVHTIIHEYAHYLQDIEGREFSEEEANAYGYSVFTPCYQQGITDTIDAIEDAFSFTTYPNGETKDFVISADEWESLKSKLIKNHDIWKE